MQTFAQPQVRDLAWVIASPSLLNAVNEAFSWAAEPLGDNQSWPLSPIIDDSWCEQQFQRHFAWLQSLAENPKPLLDWLHPRHSSRLGHYFEALVEFWLRHAYPRQRLLAHLQVKDGQRALGEFDYLLEDDAAHLTFHWEVAVKFYLHYRHPDGRVLWYGPNPRDRLDLKTQRLFSHQLALSRQPMAATLLRRHGLPSPIVPRLFLKGYLFYASHEDWRHAPLEAGVSPAHLRGWWTDMERFHIPDADSDTRWLYLPRLRWLALALPSAADSPLMDLETLHGFCFDLLNRGRRPPLIAAMRCDEEGRWQEISRGFVVPRRWPHF